MTLKDLSVEELQAVINDKDTPELLLADALKMHYDRTVATESHNTHTSHRSALDNIREGLEGLAK